MKRNILTLAAAAVAIVSFADDKVEVPDSTGFKFTDVKVVKTTPVKDQNKSGTCWSFAGTSFIEDEVLRKGGPELDLSEMFTVRHCYSDKAEKYVRMDGKINFAQGGGMQDVIYVMKNYGLVPESAYSGLNYGEE
jgi:bleomycin hydrolase